jgi:hypothetical protein
MHPITKEVKTEGKVVENLSIDCFDTLDELRSAVKDEQIVQYYNTQKIENERNICRAKHQPDKASKQKRMQLAFTIAFQNFGTELNDAIVQDQTFPPEGRTLVTALLNSKKVQELVDAQLTGSVS